MQFQSYNSSKKAWVKFKQDKETGRTRILNVKEREPEKPFKGVKKK